MPTMSAASATVKPRTHDYETQLKWTGARDVGTKDYAAYGRDYTIAIAGKPDLDGSADPMFRGAPDRHNPEDLFVAALSGCHMLAYLALCARAGVCVVAYSDRATGTLTFDAQGGGRFDSVTLRPTVVVADAGDAARALALHDAAHQRCFIASSSSATVRHEAVVEVAR
jgi:organic hydroperoxide reductase OsmC/OhrA